MPSPAELLRAVSARSYVVEAAGDRLELRVAGLVVGTLPAGEVAVVIGKTGWLKIETVDGQQRISLSVQGLTNDEADEVAQSVRDAFDCQAARA